MLYLPAFTRLTNQFRDVGLPATSLTAATTFIYSGIYDGSSVGEISDYLALKKTRVGNSIQTLVTRKDLINNRDRRNGYGRPANIHLTDFGDELYENLTHAVDLVREAPRLTGLMKNLTQMFRSPSFDQAAILDYVGYSDGMTVMEMADAFNLSYRRMYPRIKQLQNKHHLLEMRRTESEYLKIFLTPKGEDLYLANKAEFSWAS